MAVLLDTSTDDAGLHLKHIFAEAGTTEES